MAVSEPAPLLLIVSGPPAAGKTTLGRRLAADLRLPYVSKDGFKEVLFESLGWSDVAWSNRLGTASFALLFHVAEVLLAAGQPLAAEANFHPAVATEEFSRLRTRYSFEPVQLLVTASPEVLAHRNHQRATSRVRHPGHVDHLRLDDFGRHLEEGAYRPLDLGGPVFEVDTSEPELVDYGALLSRVRERRPPG